MKYLIEDDDVNSGWYVVCPDGEKLWLPARCTCSDCRRPMERLTGDLNKLIEAIIGMGIKNPFSLDDDQIEALREHCSNEIAVVNQENRS